MALDQLDLIKNQTQAVLRKNASGSVSKLRAQTSLVSQASRLTGKMLQKAEQVEKQAGQPRKRGSKPASQTVPQPQRPASRPAADGYVRRSPEQPIRVSADYHRKRLRKLIVGVVAVVCIAAVVWLLLQTNLLAY